MLLLIYCVRLIQTTFSVFISSRMKQLRVRVQQHSDERIQRMQETLSAIRIIKMYTWQDLFLKKITESRKFVFIENIIILEII